MTLTHKALWVIERNLNRPLTLAEIAESCGVSRYHLAHAFGESAGRSVMHYVRGRRLSAAARALANGAPDILDLALETGYESHEAFSRAFRAQFGATPEMVRRKANTEDLPMVEALNIPPDESVSLAAPTYIAGAPMLFVGLARRHAFESPQGIPAQWREFMAHYDEIRTRSAISPTASPPTWMRTATLTMSARSR